MKDQFIRRVLALFVLIFGVLVLVAVFAIHFVNVSGASADWVNHINATIHEIDGISASVQAGDGSMRAFALSGDPRDRAASREAFDEMTEHFDVGKALTRDESPTNVSMAALEVLGQKRVDLAQAVWTAREQNQAQRLQTLLATDAGSGEMAELKRNAARMRDDQFNRLAEADKIAYRNAHTTSWALWSGLTANFILLFAVGWLIRDGFNARRALAATLEAANRDLETQVAARTAELRAANESLTAQNLEARWSNLAMEHQLRYNNLIVNSVNELVFVLTRALHVTRINQAVTHLTGFTEVDLLNQPLDKVLQLGSGPAGGTPALETIARSLVSGRELRGIPGAIFSRKQKSIPVNISLLPLRDRDKVVGGVVIVEQSSPAS